MDDGVKGFLMSTLSLRAVDLSLRKDGCGVASCFETPFGCPASLHVTPSGTMWPKRNYQGRDVDVAQVARPLIGRLLASAHVRRRYLAIFTDLTENTGCLDRSVCLSGAIDVTSSTHNSWVIVVSTQLLGMNVLSITITCRPRSGGGPAAKNYRQDNRAAIKAIQEQNRQARTARANTTLGGDVT